MFNAIFGPKNLNQNQTTYVIVKLTQIFMDAQLIKEKLLREISSEGSKDINPKEFFIRSQFNR